VACSVQEGHAPDHVGMFTLAVLILGTRAQVAAR
jgi:hypothetical protein